ncbi:MAG: hypothetical protein ACYTGX_15650 [Planctomycetota bacterium]|jgi:hypothetical protein
MRRLAGLIAAFCTFCTVLLWCTGAASADEPLGRQELAPEPQVLDQALEESLNLWPLFMHARRVSPAGNEVLEQWDVLWPLFGSWQDEHRGEWGFGGPWPLVAGTWGPEHSHFRIAPLFAWWRWNDERAIALFPIGGGFWDDHGWSMLLGPFYSQNDAVTSRNVLFPLLWVFSEPKGGCLSLWPLWHAAWRTGAHDGDDTRVMLDVAPLTLLPVGAWWADHVAADTYWSVAWPLGPTYFADHDGWSFRLLWEGLVLWSDEPGHFGWRFLGGLIGRETRHAFGQLEQEFWTLFWFFEFGLQHPVVRV